MPGPGRKVRDTSAARMWEEIKQELDLPRGLAWVGQLSDVDSLIAEKGYDVAKSTTLVAIGREGQESFVRRCLEKGAAPWIGTWNKTQAWGCRFCGARCHQDLSDAGAPPRCCPTCGSSGDE